MRLNKYLSRAGVASRRECDKLIFNGCIKINGKIMKNYSYQVLDSDVVQYNNKYIEVESTYSYYLLNKPRGYICSNDDEKGRKTIFDLIPSDERLFSIGRLDYDTTGIIIITNDGDFCQLLSHPRNNFTKKYYVVTDKKLTKENIMEIKKGIKVENTFMKAIFKFISSEKTNFNTWEIILKEGKNREIKRIFANYDTKVLHLHRFEFAGIGLRNLKIGKFKKIKKNEINKIMNYENKK